MILAGDIGGTHTRLALFDSSLKKIASAQFLSKQYPNLLPIVQEFLNGQNKRVSRACFGIAGPVVNRKCRATNLPWSVDAAELSHALSIESVELINDLLANAWGLRTLEPSDFHLLQAGDATQVGNAALISAGTGLGEAGLFWDGKQHIPFACEGGHADFSPRNALEFELFVYLLQTHGHVSWERVLSGPGLYQIYRFLVDTHRESLSSDVEREMQHNDPSQVVSEWGCTGRDAGCMRAVDWFVSLYGAEAGNLALKILALGGVYIGGGIAPHLLASFKKGSFIQSFREKGRLAPILDSIPIRIALHEETALQGAAEYARTRQ